MGFLSVAHLSIVDIRHTIPGWKEVRARRSGLGKTACMTNLVSNWADFATVLFASLHRHVTKQLKMNARRHSHAMRM